MEKKWKNSDDELIGRAFIRLRGRKYYVKGWHAFGRGLRVETELGSFPAGAIDGMKKGRRRITSQTYIFDDVRYKGGGKKRKMMRDALAELPAGHHLIKKYGGYARVL